MEHKTRGRASKVDLLPSEIKDELHKMLRNKKFSQADIRASINALIDEYGLDEDKKLSRSGLNRYASRMQEMGAKIRASREMAEVWTKSLGEQPESDVGKLLMEFVKTLAFETSMALSESGEPIEPNALSQLALVASRIEQAQAVQYKREKEILADVVAKATKIIEQEGKATGLGSGQIEKMVKAVYGIRQ